MTYATRDVGDDSQWKFTITRLEETTLFRPAWDLCHDSRFDDLRLTQRQRADVWQWPRRNGEIIVFDSLPLVREAHAVLDVAAVYEALDADSDAWHLLESARTGEHGVDRADQFAHEWKEVELGEFNEFFELLRVAGVDSTVLQAGALTVLPLQLLLADCGDDVRQARERVGFILQYGEHRADLDVPCS